MASHSRKFRTVLLLPIATVLMLAVSFATAAIVVWIPESAGKVAGGEQVVGNLREYILLHKARNSAVPPYLGVDFEESTY